LRSPSPAHVKHATSAGFSVPARYFPPGQVPRAGGWMLPGLGDESPEAAGTAGVGPAGGTACGCRKPVPPGQMAYGNGNSSVKRSASVRPVVFSRRWDDLRLVGLKLVFLVVSGVISPLRLPRRESWRKDAEILMLRHQFAVAERERPKARARLGRGWRCSPGRCRLGAWPGCGCSSLRALSCAGIATSSAAGGTPVAARPVRAVGHAPQGAVGRAAARPGECGARLFDRAWPGWRAEIIAE